ncbi:MAG: ABC transporter permease [Aggregatilineaceae bacterium]
MTLSLILKRMRREWRSLAILLLAICLLTGFFALGPFYIRAVTGVGLRFALERAAPQDLQITLVTQNEQLSAAALEAASQELGPLATGYTFFIRADYTPPTTEGGVEAAGLATGGYMYRYGEPVTARSTRLEHTFQPYAFSDMPARLTLLAGRWPVRLPPPDVVDPAGLSDAEQQARQIGIYNRGQVEIVVTAEVARQANLELGQRFVVGSKQLDGSGHVASVVIVGIVEPKDPQDPFWEGNRNFLYGAEVEIAPGQFRYDFGFATVPEAYNDWLASVTPGNRYFYVIDTNTGVITADNIRDYRQRLALLQNRLGTYHPSLRVLTGLTALLEGYAGDVADNELVIIAFSALIAGLMAQHLASTTALVLEQQSQEWSTIVSRGGSAPQLVLMQLITVTLLALLGFALGPLLSVVFLRLMEHYGPLAQALGGRSLGATSIPTVSYVLSALITVPIILRLTWPAVPAARRSLARLKQIASRPKETPWWLRYYLDAIAFLVGVLFTLRLYYLIGGDFSVLLRDLLAAPGEVIARISAELTAGSFAAERGSYHVFGDYNLPVFVLDTVPAVFGIVLGLGMAWMRLFPWLMEIVSHGVQRSRHLTLPLAVWRVARDPGHYAMLVLLLIMTLALGTASLSISATRDRGAWTAAREETGSSARLAFDPAQLSAQDVRWEQLPGVQGALTLMHVIGDPGTTAIRARVHLFGVDPQAVGPAFADLAALLTPLRSVTLPPPPGLELPEEAVRLSAQVYSLPQWIAEDPPVSVQLIAYLQDALGIPYRVRLLPPGIAPVSAAPGAERAQTLPPTPVEQWLTFEGELPPGAHKPYRLMRLALASEQGNIDAFKHTIYLDRLATQDAFGTTRTLESFEDETNAWAKATVANPYAASWTQITGGSLVQGVEMQRVRGEVVEVDGPTALRLDYSMGKLGGRRREPSITVNEPHLDRLPVLINTTFARQFGARTAADEPLAVGDERNLVLNLGSGSVELGYRVVGVFDDFPSVDAKAPVMITHRDLLQPVINQAASTAYFFADNEAWLELPRQAPPDALRAAIAALGEGIAEVRWAWDRYGELQREPLPSAVAGMLFAGFWISLALTLLDFAFYLVVTARQRLFTFAVLRSLGWNAGHIWRLLLIEQVALVLPALVIGNLIGAGLAYLLLPFLALVGNETLRLPLADLGLLLTTLVVSFTVLMGIAAIFLRRMSVNQVLRLGEE